MPCPCGCACCSYGLAATEHIQEGQEVLLCYHCLASNEDLLHVWGFLERANPNDRPYPIQRPLQALPRLPWGVVLTAAGRLHDLVQLGPQALQQRQQQQGLSLSAGDLAALTDGQPVNRVLAAASSLPLAWDSTLEQLDSIAKLDAAMLLEACQSPGDVGEWCDLADGMQDALWKPWAQRHIMQAVRSRLDNRASAPTAAPEAAAAVATPRDTWDSPQQSWEATLAVLTARLLGLHARVGLLTVPTTLEEDLALEAAAGGCASLTPEQVAGLFRQQEEGDQEQQQQAHDQALEALHTRLLDCTMEVAALQTVPHDSSSSHVKVQRLQTGLADLGAQLEALTEQWGEAPWRQQQVDWLQQLVQNTPRGSGADVAAASRGSGVDACMQLAIQARLQQKMLIHVYGLLCDAIARQLQVAL
jgi:hypothetical protein